MSTKTSATTQVKGAPSSSKTDVNTTPVSESNKITTYFSVLKPEGRAKMCASKTGESKQKEILQKMKAKDGKILRSTNMTDKSEDTNVKVEIHTVPSKEKLRGNISVMSALKTPLSQVLRKSIESSEPKKETLVVTDVKANLSVSKVGQNANKDKSSEKVSDVCSQTSQRARKSFQESDSSKALRRSQKIIESTKTVPSSLKSQTKQVSDSSASPAVRKAVSMSESADASSAAASSKKSVSSPSVVLSTSPTEDKDQGSGKLKKNRKRHFRGGTYSLYLSKKKRQKRLKTGDDGKDDECSLAGTENSYLDSEDGSSLMSEDLYAGSEKSLPDEENNPDSRNSPMIIVEPKVEIVDDTQEVEEEEPENEEKDDIKFDNTLTQPDAADKKDNAIIKKAEPEEMQCHSDMACETSNEKEQPLSEVAKDVVCENMSNHDSENVTLVMSNDIDEKLETKEMSAVISDSVNLGMDLNDNSNTKELEMPDDSEHCSNVVIEEKLNFDISLHDKEEQQNLNIFQEEDKVNTLEVSSYFEEQNNQRHVTFSSDTEMREDVTDAPSTIANCVKSRQRIKRRFTDDIVDTDVGLLTLNTSMAVPRKITPPKPDPPKDVIQTFQPVTHSEAKKGPIPKVECIYNSHQEPVRSCTCEGDTYEVNIDNEEGVFCQAVDSIDDKLVGCSNPVVTSRLVRPSVKIPFNIMCEMHLWRLKHHHSCPYCGLFCSQGTFMQCSSTVGKHKVVHLYHENCGRKEEGFTPFCLHCGTESGIKRVVLEMHMATPPSFYLSQLPSNPIPVVDKAKITFSSTDVAREKEEGELSYYHRVEDTGKVLSSGLNLLMFLVGLTSGPEKDELDRLLQIISEESIIPHLGTPDELYDAASEGNVLKVLNLLAQGADPNQKFDSHEKETALHAAATAGHATVVHLLIQAGAVTDAINERIYTPLMLAAENKQKDIVFYLVKNGAITDFKGENGMSSLHLAAKNGCLEIIKIIMSSREVDINSQDDGGWTPIVWASEHDHYEVVKYLLQRGANPNIKDNEGNTGLHWSAFSGSVDICFLYLDYGCDINAVNELGDTPLHIASRQDSFSCVTLFLSRGAEVQLKNKAGQIPAECVIDKKSDTYLSLSLNLLLKRIAGKYQHKPEKVVHRDISRGKEQIAIPCVNDVDDEPPPVDFLYVTENCETTPMNIDRTITSLQSCYCEDDCSTATCTCASISYQCWYDKEGLLLPNFNLLDPPMLFECNRACSCWSLNCRNRIVQNGMTCRLQLIRTKGKGWGVRTLKDIPKGTFICEYVGEMISDSAADKRADDSYLFDLDNRDGETYCLDARYYGNISRFINHLCEPNLVPVKVYVDHQDLNFPRIAFFSSREIKQYEELGFDYCEKFWVIKYKYFTCDCGSAKCKYSKDTIHTTLANYYRRVREEQLEEGALQPAEQETQESFT